MAKTGRRGSKRRKSSPTYAQLKREADKVFSAYIRQREKGPTGWATCVTCGYQDIWKRLQCGHYVSRTHLATRWNEKNAAVQCYACNILRRGNHAEFTLYLQGKYGQGIIEELVEAKHRTVKYTRAELQELIDSYTRLLTASTKA